ncbi:MAG: hypothetical protein HYY55_00200 [Candidatus Niyogibacteria bacterium]|nr:MAG: hypothetical protein HYY55_00200 [Candidatus Niyogibacteria bacterium]
MNKHKKTFSKRRFPAITLIKTLLAILGDITTGTAKAFWPHPYYHTFCEHGNIKAGKRSVYQGLYQLRKKGLVKHYKKDGEQNFILTREGKKKSKIFRTILEFADFFIGPSKYDWDGKWRIIIFDIPERLRKYRDFLRTELKTLNFYPIQKSVWIHPLPIPEDFWKEIVDPALLPFVRIGILENLDRENELKEYFFGDK